MEVSLLIQRSQSGGPDGRAAAYELLYYIAEEYRDRKIQRYFSPSMSFADREDIRQAFLVGCYTGIIEARLDIGDPLAFILKKGQWSVADVIRKDGQKELQQECLNCHTTGKPNRIHGRYVCRQCGSDQVALQRRVISHAKTIEATGYNQDDRLTIKEFRDQLTGRKREVFDLIMHGYDRDNCRNYLQEIGQILGISTTNASLRLRQIREAWVQYETVG